MLAAGSQNTAWRNASASGGSSARRLDVEHAQRHVELGRDGPLARGARKALVAAVELEPAGVAHVALGARLRHQRFVLALADHLAAMKIGDERDDAGTEGGAGRHVSRRAARLGWYCRSNDNRRGAGSVVTGLIGGNPRGHASARALAADAFHHRPEHGGSARKPLAGWANICPGKSPEPRLYHFVTDETEAADGPPAN
jgi:hypothetical protein